MSEHADWGGSPPGGIYREAEQLLPLASGQVGWRLLAATLGVSTGVVLILRGPGELAAWGLAGSLALLAWVLGATAVLAGAPWMAEAMAGSLTDRSAVRGLWRQSVQVALVACGLTALAALAAPLLPGLVERGLPAGTGRAAVWWCLSVLPGLLAVAFAGTLWAIGQTSVVALSGLLAFVLNLVVLLLTITDLGSPALTMALRKVMGMLAYPLSPPGPLPAVLAAAIATTLTGLVTLAVLWLALWTVPRRATYGWRATSSWAEVTRWDGRRTWQAALPAMARLAPSVLTVAGLVVLAAGLPAPSLAALAGLGVLAAPVAAVGWGFAQAGAQRVAAVRREGQMRPGAVTRCGQRCGRLALVAMLLACLFHAVAPRDLVQALFGKRELGEMVFPLLPVALGLVVLDALALLNALSLENLDEGRLAWPVQLGGALVALLLAGVAGRVLQMGLTGMLVVVALVALARVWMLSSRFKLAAGGADGAAAEAVRRHAHAIAHGWADTVMLRPAGAEDALGGPRGRGRRRASSAR